MSIDLQIPLMGITWPHQQIPLVHIPHAHCQNRKIRNPQEYWHQTETVLKSQLLLEKFNNFFYMKICLDLYTTCVASIIYRKQMESFQLGCGQLHPHKCLKLKDALPLSS